MSNNPHFRKTEKYWVGQNVYLGFSIRTQKKKTQTNLWSAQYFVCSVCISETNELEFCFKWGPWYPKVGSQPLMVSKHVMQITSCNKHLQYSGGSGGCCMPLNKALPTWKPPGLFWVSCKTTGAKILFCGYNHQLRFGLVPKWLTRLLHTGKCSPGDLLSCLVESSSLMRSGVFPTWSIKRTRALSAAVCREALALCKHQLTYCTATFFCVS